MHHHPSLPPRQAQALFDYMDGEWKLLPDDEPTPRRQKGLALMAGKMFLISKASRAKSTCSFCGSEIRSNECIVSYPSSLSRTATGFFRRIFLHLSCFLTQKRFILSKDEINHLGTPQGLAAGFIGLTAFTDFERAQLCKMFVKPSHASAMDDALQKAFERAREPKDMGDPCIPGLHLKVPLEAFQIQGVLWMQRMEASPTRGGILADENAMGKTAEFIGLMKAEAKGCSLVVCPAQKTALWVSEIQKFSDLRVYQNSEADFQVLVLSDVQALEVISQDSWVMRHRWERLILDEAHELFGKPGDSEYALIPAKFRWASTSSPVTGCLTNFFRVVDFLQIYPHSYYLCQFCEEACVLFQKDPSVVCSQCEHPSSYHKKHWVTHIQAPLFDRQPEGLQKLEALLDEIMLRRLRADHGFRGFTYCRVQTEGFGLLPDEVRENGSAKDCQKYLCHPSLLFEYNVGEDLCGVCLKGVEEDTRTRAACDCAFHLSCILSRCQEHPELLKTLGCPACEAPHFSVDLDATRLNDRFNHLNRDAPKFRVTSLSSVKLDALIQEIQGGGFPCLVITQFPEFLKMIQYRLALEKLVFQSIQKPRTTSQSTQKPLPKLRADTQVFLALRKTAKQNLGLETPLEAIYFCDLLPSQTEEWGIICGAQQFGLQRTNLKIVHLYFGFEEVVFTNREIESTVKYSFMEIN